MSVPLALLKLYHLPFPFFVNPRPMLFLHRFLEREWGGEGGDTPIGWPCREQRSVNRALTRGPTLCQDQTRHALVNRPRHLFTQLRGLCSYTGSY